VCYNFFSGCQKLKDQKKVFVSKKFLCQKSFRVKKAFVSKKLSCHSTHSKKNSKNTVEKKLLPNFFLTCKNLHMTVNRQKFFVLRKCFRASLCGRSSYRQQFFLALNKKIDSFSHRQNKTNIFGCMHVKPERKIREAINSPIFDHTLFFSQTKISNNFVFFFASSRFFLAQKNQSPKIFRFD